MFSDTCTQEKRAYWFGLRHPNPKKSLSKQDPKVSNQKVIKDPKIPKVQKIFKKKPNFSYF
jgi:hypothetical protein